MTTQAFMLFHLNLAYSSISEAARQKVIEQCYFPLLNLIKKTKIPIGIEITGWTLRQIQIIDPVWIEEFKELLKSGQSELIGSGYTQLIGPLVPWEVNLWNQQLGLEDYETILGVKPNIILVNEMAFSTGMVELYQKVGYDGMIMDRDNIRLALNIEDYEGVPSHAMGLNNSQIPVLWSDSILFQKLQRFAHGDSRLSDYLGFFRKRAGISKRPLAVYCNDAEIFDYRPGRFREERPAHEEGEWRRLERLLNILTSQEKVDWLSPTEALKNSLDAVPHSAQLLSTISQPIPVKKQAKYNVSRWAISGRNDLRLNTRCHRIAKALEGTKEEKSWRTLCELWASDLRTHIESHRWETANQDLKNLAEKLSVSLDEIPAQISFNKNKLADFKISQDPEGILLNIDSPHVQVVFNLRRGLALQSLAFLGHDFVPVIGTLPHGYFDSIEYGADFYSGGVVMELPLEHRRITDLERVKPKIEQVGQNLHVSVEIETDKGLIVKRYVISSQAESIKLMIEFPDWQRSHSVLRVGTLTLLPEAFSQPVYLKTCNGGSGLESFLLNQDCDHTASASSLVSCTTGFGATTGEIILGDVHREISISWDPAQCAFFPMLSHQLFKENFLTRLFFSLGELDDTMRVGGVVPSFEMMLSRGVGNAKSSL